VHEVPSGSWLNGWYVPPMWRVKRAELRQNGALIYDGALSPLGVPVLSPSHQARVGLEELRSHLFYSDEVEDAIVYHWTTLYRPKHPVWGFCMPKRSVDALSDGLYDVDIETETEPGTMKVLDYVLPGDSDETVILNAHNCHPFQANDDLSGCAVGIAVIQRLAKLPRRRLTYRLVIGPELIGTAFWLEGLPADELRSLRHAVMLKSVGNDRPLKLQDTFTGTARVDLAANNVMRNRFGAYEHGAFRTIYGNDETVFEAPGFEIPSISLTRYPFVGYHTDHDTPDRLSEDKLAEAADVTFDICMALERDVAATAQFRGLVCLSHHGLYMPAPAPGIDRSEYSDQKARWNLLMNCLPRYLEGKTRLLDIAERFNVPIRDLAEYVDRWVDAGLAKYVL
jgi:aminopeptidase-like protein